MVNSLSYCSVFNSIAGAGQTQGQQKENQRSPRVVNQAERKSYHPGYFRKKDTHQKHKLHSWPGYLLQSIAIQKEDTHRQRQGFKTNWKSDPVPFKNSGSCTQQCISTTRALRQQGFQENGNSSEKPIYPIGQIECKAHGHFGCFCKAPSQPVALSRIFPLQCISAKGTIC